MKRIILSIAFFFLTQILFSLDHSVERQAMILNEKGVALIESNSEKALEYIRQAHSLVKEAPEYINNIGVVYAYNGQYRKALPYFEKAIEYSNKATAILAGKENHENPNLENI